MEVYGNVNIRHTFDVSRSSTSDNYPDMFTGMVKKNKKQIGGIAMKCNNCKCIVPDSCDYCMYCGYPLPPSGSTRTIPIYEYSDNVTYYQNVSEIPPRYNSGKSGNSLSFLDAVFSTGCSCVSAFSSLFTDCDSLAFAKRRTAE